MSSLARLAVLVAAISLLPPPSSAQSPASPQLIPRTHSQREQNYRNLHRIFLNVQVTTPSGQPAEDLHPAGFTLLVDHQPQAIASFQSIHANPSAIPARVVLVVDALNNSAGKVAAFRKEIAKYLQSSSGPLPNPTAIAVLSERGLQLGETSTDRARSLHHLDTLSSGLHAISCRDTTPEFAEGAPDGHRDPNPRLDCLSHLFNSSVSALNTLAESLAENHRKAGQARRNIIIWIGRGWPLLNNRGYTPDSPETKAGFYRNLVSISSALAQGQVTLSAVASTEVLPVSQKNLTSSYFVQGVSNAEDAVAANLSLQAFALQSGGMVFNTGKDLAAQIARCVADAQSYYQLSFEYPPSPTFGQQHALEVKIDQPDLTVRTRTLYYAEQ